MVESLNTVLSNALSILNDREQCYHCPLYSPEVVCAYMIELLGNIQLLALLLNDAVFEEDDVVRVTQIWQPYRELLELAQLIPNKSHSIDRKIETAFSSIERLIRTQPSDLPSFEDVVLCCPTRQAAVVIWEGLSQFFVKKRQHLIDSPLLMELDFDTQMLAALLTSRFRGEGDSGQRIPVAVS